MSVINPKGKNKWGYIIGGHVATNEELYKLFKGILINNKHVMRIWWVQTDKIDEGNPWREYYRHKTGSLPSLIHKRLQSLTESKPFNKEDWL